MVTKASDMKHIWAECIPVATDVGCILSALPATDGIPSLGAVAWMGKSRNFLVGRHVYFPLRRDVKVEKESEARTA